MTVETSARARDSRAKSVANAKAPWRCSDGSPRLLPASNAVDDTGRILLIPRYLLLCPTQLCGASRRPDTPRMRIKHGLPHLPGEPNHGGEGFEVHGIRKAEGRPDFACRQQRFGGGQACRGPRDG